jgi:polyisoprenoid-binding protein YceI
MRPLALLLLTCALPAAAQEVSSYVPAQTFTLDPAHSTVVFRVNHMGLSTFTSSFDTVTASLTLDPANPTAAALSVQIDPMSMDLPSPAPAGFMDSLMSDMLFDTAKFPEITYVSDSITMTGDKTATIQGTLTLHGVSQPVTLNATFNGGYGQQPFEPNSRIGFSATTEFDRSAFGMGFGVPAEGTTLGVGDLIEVRIETEWIGPLMQ